MTAPAIIESSRSSLLDDFGFNTKHIGKFIAFMRAFNFADEPEVFGEGVSEKLTGLLEAHKNDLEALSSAINSDADVAGAVAYLEGCFPLELLDTQPTRRHAHVQSQRHSVAGSILATINPNTDIAVVGNATRAARLQLINETMDSDLGGYDLRSSACALVKLAELSQTAAALTVCDILEAGRKSPPIKDRANTLLRHFMREGGEAAKAVLCVKTVLGRLTNFGPTLIL